MGRTLIETMVLVDRVAQEVLSTGGRPVEPSYDPERKILTYHRHVRSQLGRFAGDLGLHEDQPSRADMYEPFRLSFDLKSLMVCSDWSVRQYVLGVCEVVKGLHYAEADD